LGLVTALAVVVLTNRMWAGAVTVGVVLLIYMTLSFKARFVPSTGALVRKSRLALAALLLLTAVFIIWDRVA
jgi:hypothetical protein